MAKRGKNVVEVLTLAKDIVSKRWCQGTFCKKIQGQLRYCALGAIAVASGVTVKRIFRGHSILGLRNDRYIDAREALSNTLRTASHKQGQTYVDIPDWNDREATTQGEVVAAFDAAIANATP